MKTILLFIITIFCFGGWGATSSCEEAYKKRKPNLLLRSQLILFSGKGKDLSNMDFRDTGIGGGILESANLRGSDFTALNMFFSNLRYADATNADFTSANLTQAILTKAILDGAILIGAKLNGARLERVDLTKVIGLEMADWKNLPHDHYDPYTKTNLLGAKVTKEQAEHLKKQGVSGFVVVD